MARYQIDLCGPLSDPLGGAVALELAQDELRVADLRAALLAAHPALAPLFAAKTIRTCVDDMMVNDDARVTPASAIAFFPPVSGG